MSAIVIAFLIVILVLVVKYFNQKIEKKDNEIRNLLSNITTLKARKDECENELLVIQYTQDIKNNSIKELETLNTQTRIKKNELEVLDNQLKLKKDSIEIADFVEVRV